MIKTRHSRGRSAHRSAKREPRNWALRGAVALTLLLIGGIATANSLAKVVAKVSPARASVLAPDNGVILGKNALRNFIERPAGGADTSSAILARRALLKDPTATEALTVLGFQAQLNSQETAAGEIFSYSIQLSRRELRPRIWAIEEAVTRGDIGGALRQYDVALRTSRAAPNMLFPTLASALDEQRIRIELLKILATGPVWREEFIEFASTRPIEPEGMIALVAEGADIGLKIDSGLKAELVNSLVTQGKPEAAWAFYRTFRPGVRPDRSRDPSFDLQAQRRSVFDWRTDEGSRIGSALLAEGSGGVLDFAVPPGASGILVTQKQMLPPGSYVLEGISRGLEQPERSRPYWTLTCSDGREIARVPVPNSDTKRGRFTERLAIPDTCRNQNLTLVARSSDDILGVSGQIVRVEVRPL